MKRVILTFSIALFSIASVAQVKYFEGPLAKAVEKANEEHKIVLVMASSTN